MDRLTRIATGATTLLAGLFGVSTSPELVARDATVAFAVVSGLGLLGGIAALGRLAITRTTRATA